ncbi:hypothetical protein [Metabacillus sp. SLBN-84]
MFGWDVQNSKSDRIKLFLFLLAVFLIVGFAASTFFRSTSLVSPVSKSAEIKGSPSEESEDTSGAVMQGNENEYDQTEKFTEEELSETKDAAVGFAKAFHTYDAEKPDEYLSNAKPYMTEALYKKMKRNGRREVLERSYLSVRDTEVTPVSNKSSTVVRWNVIVRGEATSVDGKTSQTEDWYLMSLREADGEWKVEDVRVNVPN